MQPTRNRPEIDRLRSHNARLRKLCDLTAEVARLRDERTTLKRIVDTAAALLGVQTVHLALVDREEQSLYGVISSGKHAVDAPRLRFQLSRSPGAQEALRSKRPVAIGEATADPRVNPEARDLMDIRGVCYVPLLSGNESFGLLILITKRPHIWADEDIDLAKQFASVAAVALENSHLMTQLATAESRLRSLIEHIPAIVYVCEYEAPYNTIYISPQTEAILGITPEEWLQDRGSLFMKIVHPEDLRRIDEANYRDVKKGFSTLEYRILDRNGEIRWFRDEAVLVRDPAGKPIAWHGVMVEITSLKKTLH